ncbi:hypothetical protein ACRALDRAFT_1059098 [Sodiomyces alcalophilus JCM 7366]|uniref:uncharacterized protein n=1 Tax=Sodiomyces alcalophilus JCM 7366 TaxID=591952 RepID=UPI0039B3B9E2
MAGLRRGPIFSPTVARIAASNAKDWGFVDTWLASKFPGRSVPTFERNNDTLRDLLALASINEVSDEECQRIALAESAALRKTQSFNSILSGARDVALDASGQLRPAVLNCLEEFLPRDDRTLLDAMAFVSLELDISNPIPEFLAEAMIHIQCKNFNLEDAHGRVQFLRNYVKADTAKIDELLRGLLGGNCMPPSDQARHNLDIQRRTKYQSSKISEVGDRLVSRDAGSSKPHLMINQLADREIQYSSLLAQKRALKTDVSRFASLPETADLARGRLEQLRSELRSLTQQRDAFFEHLVERESPRKGW